MAIASLQDYVCIMYLDYTVFLTVPYMYIICMAQWQCLKHTVLLYDTIALILQVRGVLHRLMEKGNWDREGDRGEGGRGKEKGGGREG